MKARHHLEEITLKLRSRSGRPVPLDKLALALDGLDIDLVSVPTIVRRERIAVPSSAKNVIPFKARFKVGFAS